MLVPDDDTSSFRYQNLDGQAHIRPLLFVLLLIGLLMISDGLIDSACDNYGDRSSVLRLEGIL